MDTSINQSTDRNFPNYLSQVISIIIGMPQSVTITEIWLSPDSCSHLSYPSSRYFQLCRAELGQRWNLVTREM